MEEFVISMYRIGSQKHDIVVRLQEYSQITGFAIESEK
jgi:hypothetical protein